MKYVNNTLFQMAITIGLTVLLGTLEIVKPHAAVSVPAVQVNMPAPKVVLIGGAHPSVQAVVYGAEYCIACVKMKKAIKAEMPKDGWKLAEATNAEEAKAAHIIFDYRPEQINNQKLTKFPTIIFFKDGVEVRRIEQLISPEDIAKNYNEVGEAK